MNKPALDLTVMQNEQASIPSGSAGVCEGPGCSNRFEPSGPKVRPRRFCSAECCQRASIIRRAAEILAGLSDEQVLRMIR